MAIVLTNGKHYIWYTKTGATKKVSDINLAYQFPTVADAIKGMKKQKRKLKIIMSLIHSHSGYCGSE